jgi:RNA polymerase sigma-70 factor, ECF subfamily
VATRGPWERRATGPNLSVMTTLLTHGTRHGRGPATARASRIRSDEELVALVRAGNPQAFDQIVARHQGPLTAFVRHTLGGSHHDAEEVVQDVFVKALGALRRRPDQDIVLKPWLYAIARNASLDRLRRPVRTTALEPLEPVLRDHRADPFAAAARREDLRVLVGGLQELPARQRAALVMHELEGRSHEDMARRLDVSVGASKALVCRARQGMAALRAAA